MEYRLHKTSTGYELHDGPDKTGRIGIITLVLALITVVLSLYFKSEGSLRQVADGNTGMATLFALNVLSLVAVIVSFVVVAVKHNSTKVAKLPDAAEYSLLANIPGKKQQVQDILDHVAGIYRSDVTKKEKKKEEMEYRVTIRSILGLE